MSLQPNWNPTIPTDTARLGQQLFAPEDPYRLVGDQIQDFLQLQDFRPLYAELGRGAICPVILSLVLVFQFLENIPDRVAARRAVTRLDWKYALHVPLDWRGFHFSALSNFRRRLIEHGAEHLIFERGLPLTHRRLSPPPDPSYLHLRASSITVRYQRSTIIRRPLDPSAVVSLQKYTPLPTRLHPSSLPSQMAV